MEMIEAIFADLSKEQVYQKIILLGQQLPPFPEEWKTKERLVFGCQSELYLHTQRLTNGTLSFMATSDALISKGLAALLILAYNNRTPEEILTTPPTFLQNLQITSLLSPSRSNGLYSLYLRMKQDALKLI